MALNIDAALAHLVAIKVPPWGQGKCARHVRMGLAAGGLAVANTLNARDYGPNLVAAGFVEHAGQPADGYKRGDVVVMQPIVADAPGHIQMHDGVGWISDHQQPHGFWPSNAYKAANPSYKTYRYPQ